MNISVSNLTFSYNQTDTVLKDISFSVNSGDLLCVLGPNGCGKSTLFKCLVGRFRDYEGSIRIDEKDLRELSRRDFSGSIAYVPQHFQNVYDYTVTETVLMGTARTLNALSSPGKRQLEYVQSALDMLEITNLSDKSVNSISGGERQLVYIARALAQNAKALVMDEPLSALDFGHRTKIMNQIKSLSNKGYIIIMSTHDPSVALNISSKILAMKKGENICFGNTSEILNEELLSSIYDENLGIIEKNNQKLLYLK